MQHKWYADNRDLVKWSVLLRLAEINHMDRILQIAYYRPSKFGIIQIDGSDNNIPNAVLKHFRRMQNIRKLNSKIRVSIFDETFQNRQEYHDNVITYLSKFKNFKCIVFLDPDTGLQPPNGNYGLQHLLDIEVKQIWNAIKNDDILVFYQHQTNRNGQPWIEPKRDQLARAIGIENNAVKISKSDSIARDVVFYYLAKTN